MVYSVSVTDPRPDRTVSLTPLAIGALACTAGSYLAFCCCGYLGPILALAGLALGVAALGKSGGVAAERVVAIVAIVGSALNLLIVGVALVFAIGSLGMGGELFPVYPDGPPPDHGAAADSGLGATGPLMPGVDAGGPGAVEGGDRPSEAGSAEAGPPTP